jgi:hypothetical protein
VEALEHEAEHLESLASYRHCTERIQTAWPEFLTKRDQRLEQQRRRGEACEKVAENILEDLFTTVLDWPLADFNNQVEHADIVLTDHGIKRLVVEVKRPGSLAWSRKAVESALDQALRYADEQRVKAVAISDGLMLYVADIADGGLRDRLFVSLSESNPLAKHLRRRGAKIRYAHDRMPHLSRAVRNGAASEARAFALAL